VQYPANAKISLCNKFNETKTIFCSTPLQSIHHLIFILNQEGNLNQCIIVLVGAVISLLAISPLVRNYCRARFSPLAWPE